MEIEVKAVKPLRRMVDLPRYDLPDLPQYHLPELRGRRGRHEYIEVFRGLKFEPVDKSRSSGTQRLGKIAILGQPPDRVACIAMNWIDIMSALLSCQIQFLSN